MIGPWRTSHHGERGAALLVVLACLIITVMASTILISAAATLQTQRRLNSCDVIADDLLRAAEAPIQYWLVTQSEKVVLPAEIESPRVPILHDRWVAGGVTCDLAVTAWDQCGMVPIGALWGGGGSPLRLVLPEDILQRIDSVEVPADAVSGLDLFAGRLATDATESSPFPPAAPSNAIEFNEESNGERISNSSSSMRIDASLHFGEVVATHNSIHPGPATRVGKATAVINVNTAPISVVEAAMRAAGRGGLEAIVAVRQQGKSAAAGDSVQGVNRGEHPFVPELVASSSAWSFRIDLQVGELRKSWWSIYEPKPRVASRAATTRPANQFQWECVQRLAITF